MSQKTAKTIEKQEKSQKIKGKYPIILGNTDYIPTMLQSRILWLYLTNNEGLSPTQIMEVNGHDVSTWYKWKNKHTGFNKWFRDSVEHAYKDRLDNLWNALYRRGLTQDTAAAKLFIQRYDPAFTERSSTDSKHTFAGFTPGDAGRARERMRKAIDSKDLSKEREK